MARCKNCGKANRDGALFCQDCGRPIDGTADSPGGTAVAGAGAVGTAQATAAVPAEPVIAARIPAAGLDAVALPIDAGAAAPAGKDERIPGVPQVASTDQAPCDNCGSPNPLSVSFCRTCGQNLNNRRPPQAKIACGHCGHPTPAGFMYCQHCGNRLIPEAASRSPSPRRGSNPPQAPAQGRAVAPAAPVRSNGDQAGRDKGGLRGRFVVLRRDGSDGDVLTLSGESCDLGRSTHRCFADDPYLAPRHLRLSPVGGGVRVRALDSVNGVFWQLREPHELQTGDVFFVGRELIRFELLLGDERDQPAVSEQGVRVLGSIPRESWGRLRQLTTAAVSRDVWHLSRAEILLGREEGDIVFPDDEFMSRRHALVSRLGGKVRLEDQNSSNGTYVRLRGDRDLMPGDVIRLGEQVLRYEP